MCAVYYKAYCRNSKISTVVCFHSTVYTDLLSINEACGVPILNKIIDHHLMLQHDNARPHVASICTQFLEAENIPVLAWPSYSPDMSPIEHVWDALDLRLRQRVPIPANIHQLHTAIEEEWTNIPQATVNNLINSMRRRCAALREANGGHTRYWLVFGPPRYSKTANFRVAFYFGQPKAHLCNNHAV